MLALQEKSARPRPTNSNRPLTLPSNDVYIPPLRDAALWVRSSTATIKSAQLPDNPHTEHLPAHPQSATCKRTNGLRYGGQPRLGC
jgi:hypothetical protein